MVVPDALVVAAIAWAVAADGEAVADESGSKNLTRMSNVTTKRSKVRLDQVAMDAERYLH